MPGRVIGNGTTGAGEGGSGMVTERVPVGRGCGARLDVPGVVPAALSTASDGRRGGEDHRTVPVAVSSTRDLRGSRNGTAMVAKGVASACEVRGGRDRSSPVINPVSDTKDMSGVAQAAKVVPDRVTGAADRGQRRRRPRVMTTGVTGAHKDRGIGDVAAVVARGMSGPGGRRGSDNGPRGVVDCVAVEGPGGRGHGGACVVSQRVAGAGQTER